MSTYIKCKLCGFNLDVCYFLEFSWEPFLSTTWNWTKKELGTVWLISFSLAYSEVLWDLVCDSSSPSLYFISFYFIVGVNNNFMHQRSFLWLCKKEVYFITSKPLAPTVPQPMPYLFHSFMHSFIHIISMTITKFATILAIVPLVAATSIVFMIPAYWIPNFDPRHHWHRFLFYLLLQFLTSMTLVSLSHVLAVVCCLFVFILFI